MKDHSESNETLTKLVEDFLLNLAFLKLIKKESLSENIQEKINQCRKNCETIK
jgi:hypothetical protein